MRRGSGRVTGYLRPRHRPKSEKKTGDDIQQSGFPATARSDDANKLTRCDIGADIFQNVEFASPGRLPEKDGIARNSVMKAMTMTKSLRRVFTFVLHFERLAPRVSPADCVEFFQLPNEQIQHEPDQADHDHAGDDKIVAFAGIARVNDEIAESAS